MSRKSGRKRLSASLKKLDVLFDRACDNHANGALEAAARDYRRILTRHPHHIPSLLNYALLLREVGELAQAISMLEPIVRAGSGDPTLIGTFGNFVAEIGHWSDARSFLTQAHKLAPADPMIRFNLARVLQRTGDPERSIELLEVLARESPDDPNVWVALGSALIDGRRGQDGMVALARAIDIDPRCADAFNEQGLAQLALGDFETAAESFRRAYAADPSLGEALFNLVRTKRYVPGSDQDVARIQFALQTPLSDSARSFVHFALGKVYDDRSEYDEAFDQFRQANLMWARDTVYSPGQRHLEIDRLCAVFTEELFAECKPFGASSEKPIFIVGMPRSGTSLVEQMLTTHSKVVGCGERPHIHRLAQSLGDTSGLGYPDVARTLANGRLKNAAAAYLDELPTETIGAPRITDKMPGNYNHLGLIALLFPNARIIHCARDGRDTGLSLFFQPFPHGHDYSFDLEHIVAETRSYERLMRHWETVLPVEVYRCQYENLVVNTESELRGLLAYCGLGWEPECLAYYETPGQIRSASNWQVRQPIYRSSMGRWKGYESNLGPLATLAPAEPRATSFSTPDEVYR